MSPTFIVRQCVPTTGHCQDAHSVRLDQQCLGVALMRAPYRCSGVVLSMDRKSARKRIRVSEESSEASCGDLSPQPFGRPDPFPAKLAMATGPMRDRDAIFLGAIHTPQVRVVRSTPVAILATPSRRDTASFNHSQLRHIPPDAGRKTHNGTV